MDSFRFTGRDGVPLAGWQSGAGRPLIMLHGFMGTGQWMMDGWGGAFAAAGRRVVAPDLRGHGDSAKPHDPAGCPPDVLADDGLALVEQLGLEDGEYDLGGYSLGARIVLRMLVRGARPGRAIAVGQGLAKVCGPQGDASRRLLDLMVDGTAIEAGSREARIVERMRQSGVDARALRCVVDSMVATSPEELGRIGVPVLVGIGDRDERQDADELAALLGNAEFVRVPGDHGSAFAAPELAAAMAGFLAEG